jgi:hypothetical protein
VAIERLSLTAQGLIRYALKTPYRDGTTHVIFEPLDFLAGAGCLCFLSPSPGQYPWSPSATKAFKEWQPELGERPRNQVIR